MKKTYLALRQLISPFIQYGATITAHLFKHPRYLTAFPRLFFHFQQCKKLRQNELHEGVTVPLFLILSLTKRCNLKCAGCYAHPQETSSPLISFDSWKKIIREANDLGIFGFVLAGGEPFLFPNLIELPRLFPNNLFVLFTNGTLCSEKDLDRMSHTANLAVFVSIEGDEHHTNNRRGTNVHQHAMQTLTHLIQRGIPCGISVTITKSNYGYWIKPETLTEFMKMGVHLGFFLEYIPSSQHDCQLQITFEERERLHRYIEWIRDHCQIFLIHSPGDEVLFGGCLSAGRGFAHVAPNGDLTPCPVSLLATHNLKNSNLREGLMSPLFTRIRQDRHLLETEGSPCALSVHTEELAKLAKEVGAYQNSCL